MERLKYIRKVAEAYPYEYEQPPICKAELYNFSRANENDEARKEAVCLVASISYGNEYCKDPERLWNLLIERGHESPFEFVRIGDSLSLTAYNLRNNVFQPKEWYKQHCEFINERVFKLNGIIATFKLKVPIFVARHIQRHRAFSYMEMSRRYVKGDKVEFEFWMCMDSDVISYVDGFGLKRTNRFYFPQVQKAIKAIINTAKNAYEVIANYLKPEQARAFLPLGLYTQFWMQGDYKAWLNFFIHRLHPEAQEETRLVAQAMWNLLKEHQPEIIGTMADYLEEWVKMCNPMFRVAREKKAEWLNQLLIRGKVKK